RCSNETSALGRKEPSALPPITSPNRPIRCSERSLYRRVQAAPAAAGNGGILPSRNRKHQKATHRGFADSPTCHAYRIQHSTAPRTGLCITFAMRIHPYEVVKPPSLPCARPCDCGRAVFAAGRARPRRAAAVHTGGKRGGGLARPD